MKKCPIDERWHLHVHTSDEVADFIENYQSAEATQLLEKVKILTEALEFIRDESDDWRSKATAYNALDEVIRIK